jgi:hypothetical protein
MPWVMGQDHISPFNPRWDIHLQTRPIGLYWPRKARKVFLVLPAPLAQPAQQVPQEPRARPVLLVLLGPPGLRELRVPPVPQDPPGRKVLLVLG